MSDDFEAHPTNINAGEAAETTLRIFLNPKPHIDHPTAQAAKQESHMVRRIPIQNELMDEPAKICSPEPGVSADYISRHLPPINEWMQG